MLICLVSVCMCSPALHHSANNHDERVPCVEMNTNCQIIIRIATLTAGASTPAKETLENIVVSAFIHVWFPRSIPLHYISPLALPAAIRVSSFSRMFCCCRDALICEDLRPSK